MQELPELPPVDRLEELSLLIAMKMVVNKDFTMKELSEILFLLDALSISELGHSLTGVSYQKLPSGPDPDGLALNQISADLQAFPLLSPERETVVALREPDLSVFSEHEKALIGRVLKQLTDANPEDLSYFSHGWMTKYNKLPAGAEVPDDTAFIFS